MLDLSGLKDLKKKLSKLEQQEVDWGYPDESDMHSDGMSQGKLAEWLNDGTRSQSGGWHIPPRPALMTQAMTSSKEFERELNDDIRRFIEGGTQSALLNKVGQHLVSGYQDTMRNWIAVGTQHTDNSPNTIRIKGFNQPFVETGEHIAAATFNITRRGS